MTTHQLEWFTDVEEVVAEPLKFKYQLAIGEEAYTSLRIKKTVFEAWDTYGMASTAAALAKSSTVASTLFPTTGFLSVIGLGTAATPVGWVIGAAILGGGAWIGVTHYLRAQSDQRVRTIPEFINTPLDILGLALFDLMAPLALKVAHADGTIDLIEAKAIERWFTHQWGFDPTFVQKGIGFYISRIDDIRITEIATALARYKRESPDCNYRAMTQEVLRFLQEVIEADGVVDEREIKAVERIAQVFKDEGRAQLARSAEKLGRKLSKSAENTGLAVAEKAAWARDTTIAGASRIGSLLVRDKGSIDPQN